MRNRQRGVSFGTSKMVFSVFTPVLRIDNHENINFVEKLYFFILYHQVYNAKHDVKSLHSGFIFRENTSHYKVGGE